MSSLSTQTFCARHLCFSHGDDVSYLVNKTMPHSISSSRQYLSAVRVDTASLPTFQRHLIGVDITLKPTAPCHSHLRSPFQKSSSPRQHLFHSPQNLRLETHARTASAVDDRSSKPSNLKINTSHRSIDRYTTDPKNYPLSSHSSSSFSPQCSYPLP